MISVTEWHWKAPDGSWKYNHLEDGWSQRDTPRAVSDNQAKAWRGREWIRVHQYLDGGVVRAADPSGDVHGE